MSKRKQAHEEHENAERWLLTYADMITLLMAFFIMLYSMSQIDIKKFSAVASSVRAELGGTALLTGSTGVGTGMPMGKDTAGIAPTIGPKVAADLARSINEEIGRLGSGMGIEVSDSGNGEVTISLPGSALLFAPGSAELTAGTLRVLAGMLPAIARRNCQVKVSGHTDDLPLRSSTYASNWELSADRARNIALYLVKHRAVSSDHCSFMGYADTQPLLPNISEANRARNRRVEISLRPLAVRPTVAVPPTVAPAPMTSAPAAVPDQPPVVASPPTIAPPTIDLKAQSAAKEAQ